MCGLAGWLGEVAADDGLAERVLGALAHRGPDGASSRAWPDAALLHTRLKIIDLTPTGDQPMANEDGSIWVVFNGEIYNHAELQRDLEARGHRFRGRSDTEVLPHLYEEHGADMFSRLRGMFTVALFDERQRRMLVARDRFGIKPLFYASSDERVAFASELNALRLVPGIDLSPDRQAIADYAAVLYIPAPLTFFSGIKALLPGELLDCRIERDGAVAVEARPFATFTLETTNDLDLGAAADRAGSLIEAGVESQLESDVPLGSLLSGGVDSSLVSAFAQRHVGDLHTFSVHMPDQEFDETWAAEAVAEHIGSIHETLELEQRQADWDRVTGALRHAGQPFADTSYFAVDAISQAMRRHVTVALSGDGGDEGFGGYHTYWQLDVVNRMQRAPSFLWRLAAPVADRLASRSAFAAVASRRMRDFAGVDDVGVVQALFSWVRPREIERLLLPAEGVAPARRLFEAHWPHTFPNGASRIDRLSSLMVEANIRLILPNDFLFKVDTASMRHSLEVRVPLLDEDLMAFGMSLPHTLRVEGRSGKRVLRTLARRHVPERVVDREKQGFALPVDSWVTPECKAAMAEVLLDPRARVNDYLARDVHADWIQSFCGDTPHPELPRMALYQRAIMVLALELALADAA